MKSVRFLIFIIVFLITSGLAAGQSVEFPVEHDHALRNKRGTLSITPERIEYKSADGKESRIWRYQELKQIKAESKTLELTTYETEKKSLGQDRVFRFKLLSGEITPEISALLTSKSSRPVTSSIVPPTQEVPVFTVPVQHKHTFGACQGTLKFFANGIVFVSTNQPDHSRLWSYRDIQTFSQPGRFRFELTSYELKAGGPTRSFNFELKEELPAGAYDYIWNRINPIRAFSNEKGARVEPPNTAAAKGMTVKQER